MKELVKKTIVIGAGGHSHSVCDILLQDKRIEIIGLIDGNAEKGFFGIDLLGGDELIPKLFESGKASYAFVAIGSNVIRRKLTALLKKIGYKMVNAISGQAYISQNALLSDGIAVMPGAVINAGVSIGEGVILNTNCSIDHDTIVSDFVHIAPGCAICGNVDIGAETFIGVGSSIIDGIKIGSETMIGAGASVVRDIPNCCTAVGVPARIIKYNAKVGNNNEKN